MRNPALPLAVLAVLGVPLASQIPATLRARLEARIDSTASTGVGLYYRDLMTGDTLAIDGLQRFHAASTMKLPVMIQLFRDQDAG
ncbi:MAG TPA: serine hydrolase, partial [Gemmatimonadales bacterium]|nr:serine hydrolase [Gemmatimonadales bacterium]